MQYGIKSDYGDVVYGDYADLATYTPLMFSFDWDNVGEIAITKYSAKGGFIKAQKAGTSKQYPYQSMTGSLQPASGTGIVPLNNGYIFLYKRRESNTDYCYCIFVTADTEADAKYKITSGGNVVTLYVNYASVAESTLLDNLMDWDESPSTDPDNDPLNELPQGGEYAELGDFSETVQQFLADLLEPETLDYGHFLTAYQLDSSNLVDIGDFLFNTNFWTALKNKFEGLSDPLSMIVSAVEIPFTLGVTPTTFKLGGIEVETDQGQPISCAKHSQRYLKYPFGSITLKEVWGTAKDYTDCDISIFLPYVGMRQIDPDLGVNSVLTLAVIIDVWTGDLNYLMEVNNNSMQNKYYGSAGVPYRWSGNCGNKIPIGKVDPSTPILNVAASLGSMAIGAGMMALTGGIGGAAAAATGGAVTAGSAVGAGAGAGLVSSGIRGAMQDLNQGFSPIAQSSGNISGAIGYMDYQYPYLVIKRGVPSYPNNWRAEIGAPRYQEFTLSDLSGYTEFAEIHADAINGASDEEKLMIEDILKAGVIL